jgi:hypothetical protein
MLRTGPDPIDDRKEGGHGEACGRAAGLTADNRFIWPGPDLYPAKSGALIP